MDERAIAYIRQYRRLYNRAAITQELLRAGFSAAQIEECWQAVESSPEPPSNPDPYYVPPGAPPNQPYPAYGRRFREPRPRLLSNGRFWLIMLGFIVGIPALTILFSLISPQLAGAVPWVGFGGSIAGTIYLASKDWVASRGLFYGLLMLYFVLPFIGIVILAGICLTGNYHV